MNINVFGFNFSITRAIGAPKTVKGVLMPDFEAEAEHAAKILIPKGSDKVFFLIARCCHMTGALRQFNIQNPTLKGEPAIMKLCEKNTGLWAQFSNHGPLKEAQP